MAKLSFKSTHAALGIGSYVEKTIKFRDKNGEEIGGEILIKVSSHDEIVKATDVFKLKNKTDITIDQLKKALIFQTVFEEEGVKFFPKIENVGEVSPEVVEAMYKAADEVLDFSGKNSISNQTKNSGASSSPAELAEEQ
ncbi:phage tail assembly chaperone family protein, TAC [Acinetobacter proteolyticus]|nr:phage tail assembly chaperone family protein, TAC [Acinetobacter proteolyticus]WEI17147.1 phage tail assembly chaperone family protein, TAC [Acinetobacter proteolyticus]